jgi:hypothetical protein
MEERMKSQSDNLFHIVVGICEDIRRTYPTLGKGLDLDLKRLAQLLSNRGLGVFTLDLPALDTKLTQGLESGFLNSEGTTKYSKSYAVPRLFAGLYMKIFEGDSRLKSDADINAIAFLRQILCLGKKIEIPCSNKRKFAALKEYINVERQLIGPTLTWKSDSLDCHSARSRVHFCDSLGPDLPFYPEYNIGRKNGDKRYLARLQRLADFATGLFGTFCAECHINGRLEKAEGPGLRHGPGAVAEKTGKGFDKFSFQNWSAKLESYYPYSMYGRMPNDTRLTPRNHEVPSRVITVPKTAKGPRIIAAEPSEHMFTQNLLADWFTEKMHEHFGSYIDIFDQTKSQRLVIQASRSKALATIDLSSASDRLSLWVVERIFRGNPSILKAIHASRTRWIKTPCGETLITKKFASQGTALTFPVQTFVFLMIVLASCMDENEDPRSVLKRMKGKVRVYGDDIIVPTDRYVDTVELLTALQLKVNEEKSFSSGNFRESCGMDAFKGYDVTPIKPKTTVSDNPASCQAVIDTLNNLFYKGYWNAQLHLKRRQPPRNLKGYGVVGRDAGATGFGSFIFDTVYRRELLSRRTDTQDASGLLRPSMVPRRGEGGTPPSPMVYHGCVREALELLGWRVRYNSRYSRFEVRYASIRVISTERPFDCGYSGLFQRQLRPSNPKALSAAGFEGIPDRPVSRKVHRWEPLENLFSSG